MGGEAIIKENATNQPEPINSKEMKELLILGEKNICKIYNNDEFKGTGFFCNISIGWNNNIKVLMTNNHILNEYDILPGRKVKFSINDDYKTYNFLIDGIRKTYTDESYDVTIIEISENDKIDEISFFELDDKIFKEEEKEKFRN